MLSSKQNPVNTYVERSKKDLENAKQNRKIVQNQAGEVMTESDVVVCILKNQKYCDRSKIFINNLWEQLGEQFTILKRTRCISSVFTQSEHQTKHQPQFRVKAFLRYREAIGCSRVRRQNINQNIFEKITENFFLKFVSISPFCN